MPAAYIMVTVDLGVVKNVIELIRDIEGITEVYSLYGVYDVLAKVESEHMDKIKETIGVIRRIRGIRATTTMIISNPED
jgi:DNA-binding Lrp family transcriptional regulator